MATQLPTIYKLQEHKRRLPTESGKAKHELPTKVEDVRLLLGELRDLLEDYGPVWYNGGHHERITAAMELLRQSEGDSRRVTTKRGEL